MYSFRKRKYYCKSANMQANAKLVNKEKVFDYRKKELENPNTFSKYIEDKDQLIELIRMAKERAKNYNPIELSIE